MKSKARSGWLSGLRGTSTKKFVPEVALANGKTWHSNAPLSVYSIAEERANVLTHAFGIVLSVAGLILLTTFSASNGNAWHFVSTGVFGVTLVLLYTTSTLYHLAEDTAAKQWWRKCDHAGIFLLIAGSYTPFLLVTLRGTWGWTLFAVIWGLGLFGMTLKFRFAGHFRVLSTVIYVAMGWIVLIPLRHVMTVLPMHGVWLLVIGGFFYTGGTVFYLWKKLPYHHAVWHLFVLAGSICHWCAVFEYVVPGTELFSG